MYLMYLFMGLSLRNLLFALEYGDAVPIKHLDGDIQ